MKKQWRPVMMGLAVFTVGLVLVLVFVRRSPPTSLGEQWRYRREQIRQAAGEAPVYREVRRFAVAGRPTVLAADGETLAVADGEGIAFYDLLGNPSGGFPVSGPVSALALTDDRAYVALGDRVAVYSRAGEELSRWPAYDGTPLITAVGVGTDRVWVADAGNDVVHVGDLDGNEVATLGGEGDILFKIPSPYFDLAPGEDGAVWVVDPGRVRVSRFLPDGVISGVWGEPGIAPSAFSGCCNPANIARFPDGRFVTAEKGLQRIKVYGPEGTYLGMVAPPESFTHEHSVPDVAVTASGEIAVLDPAAREIRIYRSEPPEKQE